MPLRHFLLAVAVVAIWGINFAVTKVAMDQLPPLLLAGLRFFFALFPAVFFLRRPETSWRNLALYGVLNGVGQFGLMYVAMNGRISPGLASIVIQTQVFFTIGLAMVMNAERLQAYQGAALVAGAAGLVVIGMHTDATLTLGGLGMMIGSALCWALANLTNKRAGRVNMLSYVVWASAFAVPPLFLLSWLVDGGPAIASALRSAGPWAWAAVAWQSIGNTMFGYAAWGWLLSRHPAAVVAPTSLLVPIFGMGTAALLLDEPLPGWKLGAASLIITGLVINLGWPLLRRRLAR
jgi:O-acetylserine/cysteine efflux transporter